MLGLGLGLGVGVELGLGLSLEFRFRVRVRVRVRDRFAFRVGVRGDYFLTSHSISHTTTVIVCHYYSKGWLGSGERTFITSEVGQCRCRKPAYQEHTTP